VPNPTMNHSPATENVAVRSKLGTRHGFTGWVNGRYLTVGALAAASESRLSTILSDSAAWPQGGSFTTEPWPRSADSYKRWLGPLR